MRRPVGSKGGARRTVAGKAAAETLTLDDRPLSITLTRDQKRALVVLPYELWVVHTGSLAVEKTIELPLAHPTVFEADEDGSILIGGQHLRQGNLFTGTSTKLGTKLGGYVDHVCMVRARLLCGVGSHGEVLWDVEKEVDVHRRKVSERSVLGLTVSPDGRAVFADGSSHAWVIDPEHPSGYMKLPMRRTSPVSVEREAVVALGSTSDGRTLLGAADGAVAWTNRALHLVAERFPATREGRSEPLALTGDAHFVYALRPSGILHRFLVERPEGEDELPPAQTVRLPRMATGLALQRDGQLLLVGPQFDDQLGRLWREDPQALAWEPLSLGERALVEPAPASPDEGPRRPDFTQTRSKLSGPPIAAIKVDDVLAARPPFWVTRIQGTLLERATGEIAADEVLPGDALLLPAMFRLQEGTARPGLVLWPGVPDARPLPPVSLLTWGDQPRAWLPLETPEIRKQGWSRQQVFPLQVALAHPAPRVAGRRPKLPAKWEDPELFAALAKECKKLLKVLW